MADFGWPNELENQQEYSLKVGSSYDEPSTSGFAARIPMGSFGNSPTRVRVLGFGLDS